MSHSSRDDARRAGKRALFAVVALSGAAVVAVVIGIVVGNQPEPGPSIEGEIDDGRLSEPTRLCTTDSTAPCRRSSSIERFMARDGHTIVSAEPVSAGAQGAIALALESSDGTRLRVKWRTQVSAELTNEPIGELAAHRLQALFLDEPDYVVPPAVAHCFALQPYRAAIDPDAEPLEEDGCVLGYLSYWLVGSTSLGEGREAGIFPTPPGGPAAWDTNLFDAERFERDPAYRRAFALANLVLFLTANGDAHAGQLMFYEQPLHLFVVDSSMAFRVPANPRMGLREEDLGADLLAPAIPARVAERIRGLTPADVQRLLVLDELTLPSGARVEPSEAFETDQHVRRSGDRLQVGLTSSEIGLLWNRVTELQRRLEDGDLGTF